MSAYVIGSVLGRLLISYVLVLVVLMIVSRLRWRVGLRRSVKWYGLLLTSIVFLAGISQAIIRDGGVV